MSLYAGVLYYEQFKFGDAWNNASFLTLLDRFSSESEPFKAINKQISYVAAANSNRSIHNAALYNFCGAKCAVLNFAPSDLHNQAISPYYYNLLDGHCQDVTGVVDSGWNKLSEKPPMQLLEDYYKCYPSPSSLWLDSLGIATGNADLWMKIYSIIFIPLAVFMWQCLKGRNEALKPKKEKSSDIPTLVVNSSQGENYDFFL